jgi:hypothetical protein
VRTAEAGVHQRNGQQWVNRNRSVDHVQSGIYDEHQRAAAGRMKGIVVSSQGIVLDTFSVKWALELQKDW